MKRLPLIFGLCLLMAPPVWADVLVLVHGYMSGAEAWEFSGARAVLERNGWMRGELPRVAAAGTPQPAATRTSYVVSLPAHLPLGIQADQLHRQLTDIRLRHPGEKLALAGHSAGGLVARLVLMHGNPHQVSTLITIATPHLGSPRALQGLDIVDDKPFFCPGPGFSMLKSFFGGSRYDYLEDSRGSLIDLLPAGRGGLLDWLNHQPHPDIDYYSVIRQDGFSLGDWFVPGWSQDMNQVPALRGRSAVRISHAGHGLTPGDGETIARILAGD